MNFIVQTVLTSIIIMFATLYFNSCCMIGFAKGALTDSRKPDSIEVSDSQFSEIKVGNIIKINLKTGEQVYGNYLGYKLFSLLDYKNKYETCLSNISADTFMPGFGQDIKICTIDQMMHEGILLGFSIDWIYIKDKDQSYLDIMLNQIEEISNDKGYHYSLENINNLISNKKLPFLAEEKIQLKPEVGIQSESGKQYYSEQDIDQIWYFPEKKGKLNGFLIGALIDGAIVGMYYLIFPLDVKPDLRF